MLTEDWPCTPASLFMFNGDQAGNIAALFMTGSTRMVLCSNPEATESDIVGAEILYHGGLADDWNAKKAGNISVVHDAVLRLFGWTLVHQNILETLSASGPCNIVQLLQKTEIVLFQGRLLECHTGRFLRRAYFVRCGADGRVQEVLNASQ